MKWINLYAIVEFWRLFLFNFIQLLYIQIYYLYIHSITVGNSKMNKPNFLTQKIWKLHEKRIKIKSRL